MLKARYQVIKGEFKDRLIFENYLLDHDNPKAVQANFRKLQDLAKATGDGTNYESSAEIAARISEFEEIPVLATVTIREPFVNSKGETKIDNAITKISAR